ncbi:FHA domain-containing protein [Nonomuraea sp. NPDC050310]|uniref:FHA domain-containing protein n=1 Tax=Nonomuraea sp. NPDC050310 TaxID=3154935 RepID=UPI0034090703
MSGLIVRSPAGERVLVPGQRLVIGREADIAIVDARVSRRHAEIFFHQGVWVLRDLGSRNGTYVDRRRVFDVELTRPLTVRLGGAEDGPQFSVAPQGPPRPPAPRLPDLPVTAVGRPSSPRNPQALGAPQLVLPLGPSLTIGRSPDNNLPFEDDLLVSRHHAELRRDGSGTLLRDLRSRNGTYVNGVRVGEHRLNPGDLVSVGHHQIRFLGDRIAVHADTGAVSLQAEELTVRAGQAVLLDRVSLHLEARSLMAVVGPSGAGKSTLLGALTGFRPATTGRVVYEGRDLYAHYDDLRHRIGLVPQDDILHKELTVDRALSYAAALRFPQDVTRAERERRIDEVIGQLGLGERRGLRIDRLSGGQRKRTSVALELLTKPSLLFLDEPTSGLDPSLDKEVMTTLRALADDGRTVVVVTHSVLHLSGCDRVLVLCRGGKVGYFGPPDELLGFFGVTEYAEVFRLVSEQPDVWAEHFRRSPYFARYCGAPRPGGGDGRALPAPPPPPKQSRVRQFAILAQRMASVIRSDRLAALSMIGLPIALALMSRVVQGSDGLGVPPRPTEEAGTLLIILIFGAALMGLIGAIREIVKEAPIYRRERAVGLSPLAYLLSKLAVLGSVNLVQAALFVALSLLGREPPPDPLLLGPLELTVVVALVAFTCSVLGLLVSALVSTNEQAMMAMVVLIMAQFVFIGKLIEVVGRTGLEQLAWLVPTRWGYAAAAATVDLQRIDISRMRDGLWDHDAGTWLACMGVLAGMAVVYGALVRLALRRHEP